MDITSINIVLWKIGLGIAHLIYFDEIMGLVYKCLSLGFCKEITLWHSNFNILYSILILYSIPNQ